jgi:hypothetical protein
MASKIPFKKIMMGTDLELLVTDNNGDIVDSHTIIGSNPRSTAEGIIEPDGIAIEIQPKPSTCRETLKNNLLNLLSKLPEGILFNSHTRMLEQHIFDKLHPSSLEFGCKPSFNGYSDDLRAVNEVKVKGTETKLRCCGGHLHFGADSVTVSFGGKRFSTKCQGCEIAKLDIGCAEYEDSQSNDITLGVDIHMLLKNKTLKESFASEIDSTIREIKSKIGITVHPDSIINYGNVTKLFVENPMLAAKVLDAFVGIPSVLLDRDPNAALRRTIYGKAGDYRLPPHGFEYRTLSNFWINSYFLFSFVFGMARHAILYAAHEYDNGTNCKELFDLVPCERIREAINENDFEKARDIYNDIEKIIIDTSNENENFTITSKRRSNAFKEIVLKGYKSFINEYTVIQNWKSSNGIEKWLDKLEPRENIEREFDNSTSESVEFK